MSALARERPLKNPPQIVCQILSYPSVKWILMLSADQVSQRLAGDIDPDVVGYKNGSSQVYVRFEQDGCVSDCRCNDTGCSKQVALEAKHYRTLLALACERTLSMLCFLLLLIAAILVK